MKKIWCVVTLAFTVPAADGGNTADASIRVGSIRGLVDSGWVVTIPSATSDYFSVSIPVSGGDPLGNYQNTLARGLPIAGTSVSIADFGASSTFPVVGAYRPNLALDPTCVTPDLSLPLAEVFAPSLGSPALFDWVFIDFATEGTIPPADTCTLIALRLPPGDPGLLGVGADSNASAVGTSAFTVDGYATPAVVASFLDLGMAIAQDNSFTGSCKVPDRTPHGRLRVSTEIDSDQGVDRITASVSAGTSLTLKFFGVGTKFRFWYSTFTGALAACSPVTGLGPVLSATPDPDGDGSYLTATTTWPFGYGGNTFSFNTVWGSPECPTPGVGFTNCVTLIVLADPPPPVWGTCDDGTCETGWTVTIPSASSDYFNNNYGPAPAGGVAVSDMRIAVLDFLTATAAFPTTGISLPNFGVDPSGATPDVLGAGVLVLVAPFTFPPGLFASTSLAYASQPAATVVGAGSIGHGWLQFPPGDPGLLGCGGDTTFPSGCSFFSQDAYGSPATPIAVTDFGIRVQ